MTPEQIARVRADMAVIGPIGEEVGLDIYRRLFVSDPALRAMFRDDLNAQAAHLVDALASIVASLEEPFKLTPELRALAERHIGYDVKVEHFASIERALLATLEAGLGDEFTSEARNAWTAAYDAIAGSMIKVIREGRRINS